MKESDYNKKNWFARYYNWIYGNFPNDVCTFFWGSLFAILCSHLLIPGRISYFGKPAWDYSFEHSLGRGFAIIVTYLLAIMCGTGIMLRFGYEPVGILGRWLLTPLIGLIGFSLSLGIFVGGIAAIVYYFENRKKSYNSPIRDFVGAIRQKHCTKINWK